MGESIGVFDGDDVFGGHDAMYANWPRMPQPTITVDHPGSSAERMPTCPGRPSQAASRERLRWHSYQPFRVPPASDYACRVCDRVTNVPASNF